MDDQRSTLRDITRTFGVRCLTTLVSGAVLEGLVADCSESGARIVGDTMGARVGDEAEIVFLFLSGEKVGYRCSIRHVDPEQGTIGVMYTSDPIPIKVHDTE